MRAILFLTCLALSLAAPLTQASVTKIGAHVGGLTINDAENNQVLVGAHLEIPLADFLGIRGDVSYRSEEEFKFSGDEDYALLSTTLPVTVSAHLYIPLASFRPYVTAGMGWYIQDFDFSQDLNDLGAIDDKETDVGWHVGVGTDLAIAPKLVLYGEYRAIFFGKDKDFELIEESVGDLNFNSHQVTVGISLITN